MAARCFCLQRTSLLHLALVDLSNCSIVRERRESIPPKWETQYRQISGAERLGSLALGVSMMKTSDLGTGDDRRRRRRPLLYWAVIRCVFPERIVNSVLLEIGNIFSQQPA